MNFSIKKIGPDDIDLAKELFWFFQVDDSVANPVVPSDSYVKDILLKEDFHVILALQNGELIGGLTAYELEMYKQETREMFLYEIAVEPAWRKKGVAKALIEYLKQLCAAQGIKEMYVGTSTDNKAAMNLYRSTGGDEDVDIAWFVYQCG